MNLINNNLAFSVYCASKFAVEVVDLLFLVFNNQKGLTEAIRKEIVHTPIRITNINPGINDC